MSDEHQDRRLVAPDIPEAQIAPLGVLHHGVRKFHAALSQKSSGWNASCPGPVSYESICSFSTIFAFFRRTSIHFA